MNLNITGIRPAAILSPDRPTDKRIRTIVKQLVGARPLWTIQVSEQWWSRITSASTAKGAAAQTVGALVVSQLNGPGGESDDIVTLVMQFANLQVRSLISRGHVCLHDLLRSAGATGFVNVSFCLGDGRASETFKIAVGLKVAKGLLPQAKASAPDYAQRHALLSVVADDYRRLDALPTFLDGIAVQAVEVSMVEEIPLSVMYGEKCAAELYPDAYGPVTRTPAPRHIFGRSKPH